MENKDKKFVELRNGVRMPILGLGTSLRGKPKIENQAFIDSVKYALQLGYRHIDTVKLFFLAIFILKNFILIDLMKKGKMLQQ